MSTIHPIFDALLAPFAPKPDPRDPHPTRIGMFRDHNCSRCSNGVKPCVQGGPHRCEYPHARND